jgi:hypothetical protein
MGVEYLVESLAKSVTSSMEQGPRLSDATRTRLVWHVAIAGFVLVNVKSLVGALSEKPVNPDLLPIAGVPWLIVVALALIAHFLTDKADIARNSFFINKLSLLDLHLEKVRTKKPDSKEFSSILHDTSPALIPLKQAADNLANWVNRLELSSLLAILVGLAAAIVIPFMAR